MEGSAFKVCPFCKQQIRREAIKCRFCGEWLESSEADPARKLTTDKPVLPLPTPPQETEANSMKAVGRALDETDLRQRPVNPPIPDIQNKPPKQASAKTGTSTKSIWRLIGGFLLIAGVANSMRNLPMGQTLGFHISYGVTDLLLAAIGVWLVVSYLRSGHNNVAAPGGRRMSKRSKTTLLILSVGLLLVGAGILYFGFYRPMQNRQLRFASSAVPQPSRIEATTPIAAGSPAAKLVQTEATTSPAAAISPSRSAAPEVSEIPDGSVLGISDVKVSETPGLEAEKILLHISLKKRPDAVIDPTKAKIQVFFYDTIDNREIRLTNADVKHEWLMSHEWQIEQSYKRQYNASLDDSVATGVIKKSFSEHWQLSGVSNENIGEDNFSASNLTSRPWKPRFG